MKKPRILIVEADTTIAREIHNILKSGGYTVCGSAASADEAVRKARQTSPDLLLVNIVLPGHRDGIDTVMEIRQSVEIPVIYLSTPSDKTILTRATETAPCGYVPGPTDPMELLSTIRTALYRSSTEQELRRRHEMMVHISETSPSAITVLDSSGKIIFANRHAELVLGIQKDTIDKRTFNSPQWNITDIDGKPLPEEKLPFMQVMQTKEPVQDVRHAIQPPGEPRRLLSINASPVKDRADNVEMVICTISDITDREAVLALIKTKNEDLAAANEELQAAMEELEATNEELRLSNEELARNQQELLSANTAVRDSEQKYYTLFDRMINGYAFHEMIFDDKNKPVDYRFIDINPAFEKLTGMGREIIGKTIRDIHPDIDQFWIDTYGKVVTTGEAAYFEDFASPMNKWYRVVAFRTLENRFACLFEDITERRLQEKRYRTLIESSPIAIALIRNWTIIYANHAYVKMVGYDTPEEVTGISRFEHVAPEVRDEVREINRRRVVGEDVPASYDSIGIKKDGSRFYYHITVTHLELADGPALLAFYEDVTGKKQNDEIIKTANAIFREFLSVQSSLLYTNILSIILSALKSVYGVFGYLDPEENLVALSMTYDTGSRSAKDEKSIVFPRSRWKGIWGKALEEGITHLSNTSQDVPEGHLPVTRAISVPINFRNKVIGLCMVANKEIDYTELDKVLLEGIAGLIAPVLDTRLQWEREEKERLRIEKELKDSLREKETLLKEIHHRVKNNLQIITSLLNLQSRNVSNSETAEHLQTSKNRIRAMATIHEKLYQSGTLAEIDFADYSKTLVRQMQEVYGVTASQIRIHITADTIFMPIDMAVPCGLALNELISNTFKHAFPRDTTVREFKLSLTKNRNTVEITVSDNGIGFPEEIDPRRSPSLGLSLVYILIEEQLNGTVSLERTRGTRFFLTIPMPE